MTGAGGIRTTCAYCGVGCGVVMTPDGAGGFSARGDEDHPANFGRLCSKGAALGETLGLEGRLLAPIVDGVEADWDTALDRVATAFSQAIAEHGPDSVAFYVSGQLLTEDYYVANKLMKGFIGSANIDTNSRLCMASSVAGHKRAFGEDVVPGTYADLEEADLIVLTGSNLAWCHPVLHQRILAGGAKVIALDPRSTVTADSADLHLPLKPGSDVLFWSGLMGYLRAHGHWNADFAGHVDGLDPAMPYPTIPEVAAGTGLSSTQIAETYALWAATKRVVTIYSQGVNQATDGSDRVNAILDCHLATGRIGIPGAGPFSVTGQPNAMGGREVGGLANMLAAHLDLENPAHRAAVQSYWASPTIADKPGLKAVDLFDACADGRIKALWIMCTNPAVSLPKADAVRAAIANVPFVAVSDIEAETDTTRLAHVLLPALGWGEKDGTVTNSERRISRQRAFLPAPGAARADWWHMAEVGKRMGWADAFNWSSPAEIFAEYAAMTALSVSFGKKLDLTPLAHVDYDMMAPVMWPVGGAERQFADGAFPSGKARILSPRAGAAPNAVEFHLNSGRVRDHWHTMTRTGRSATLSLHIAEPFVEMHPADAATLGVAPASLVRLSNAHGDVTLRALISDRTSPGTLFAPIHWTGETASAARINILVEGATDPVSGQPALKAGRVTATALNPAWYGFAVSAAKPVANTAYWARARTSHGWQMELADMAPTQDWTAFAQALIGAPASDPITVEDRKRGIARVALMQDGVLVGAFFAAPDPVSLSRGFLRDLIGQGDAQAALAGRPGAGMPDPGPTVCACFGVGLNTILTAIKGGAATVEQIGAALNAGTNCGACRPEMAALLPQQSIAAE
ncbi:assimilatory nitrate reductase catalytic subunit [Rubricella aquisinus]|uniref:Assimilatory nitrate reductase catalytic subunit n=1 Tax=Rubricella aquisinus TaxID=2028108 RepID=A0A840WWU2_9RHOB|nr:nitrate reductase [Rubricella aquisinus]MBB5514176.1 assimilatory nitrate reductase catalytic subunit [Rubricella aquisinus]